MAKFRIRLKLESFELEVEGNRDDVPLIAHNVGQQVAGLLQPATNIVEADDAIVPRAPGSQSAVSNGLPAEARRGSRRRGIAPSKPTETGPSPALDWVHDPGAWGTPKQEWSTAQKSIWLLYVAEKMKGVTELSSRQIAGTFNKHFKQAKTIRPQNVARDLGGAKTGAGAVVGENTTVNPSAWFLTTAGRQRAEALVKEARGEPASTP